MINLYNQPPKSIEINGKSYEVETDFRFWAEFTETVEKEPKKAFGEVLRMFAKRRIPITNEAVEAVLETIFKKAFKLSCTKASTGKPKKVVDFVQDAPLIATAFKTQYNVDLQTEKLHWWDFLEMFFGLTEEHQISKVIGYRSVDTSKMPKEQASFYKKMKRIYSLNSAKPQMTFEEEWKMWAESKKKGG